MSEELMNERLLSPLTAGKRMPQNKSVKYVYIFLFFLI